MRRAHAMQHINDKVIYQPPGRGREAAEEGVITGVTDEYVFVRYGSDTHSKATDPAHLTPLRCSCAHLTQIKREKAIK